MSKRATYVFGLKSFYMEKPPKCFWILSPTPDQLGCHRAAAVHNFLPSWGARLPGRSWDHSADKLQIKQEHPAAHCTTQLPLRPTLSSSIIGHQLFNFYPSVSVFFLPNEESTSNPAVSPPVSSFVVHLRQGLMCPKLALKYCLVTQD